VVNFKRLVDLARSTLRPPLPLPPDPGVFVAPGEDSVYEGHDPAYQPQLARQNPSGT